MARLKAIEFPVEIFQQWVTVGTKLPAFEVVEGLPEGAQFIYSFVGEDHRTASLVFEHETFEDVEMGARIPHIGFGLRACNG